MARAVLLTGGNLGDVAATLARARCKLRERAGGEVAASALYRSEPWGFDAPEHFLNQVLLFDTPLSPEALLDCCQQIEREAGRVRPGEQGQQGQQEQQGKEQEQQGSSGGGSSAKRYVSRTLDIDLLFYGDEVIATPRLTVPHPLIAQRGFVLVPLAEVAPDLLHPSLHRTVRQLLSEFSATQAPGALPVKLPAER